MAKFGEGHLAAVGRLGLKELRNAVSPSKESIADSEVGLYGTATQGEIAQARGGAGEGSEQESTMSMEQVKEQSKDIAKEREGIEKNRDMER